MQRLRRQFDLHLHNILDLLTKPDINYEQFYLVCYEANIKPISPQQSQNFMRYFQDRSIPLTQIFQIFTLVKVEVLHNKPIFRVKFANGKNEHRIQNCFEGWKAIMKQKYGSQMRWFDSMGGESACRRIKSFYFKKQMKQILEGTLHAECWEQICQKFPKNLKNQIEWSTFMAVVRQTPHKQKPLNHKSQQYTIRSRIQPQLAFQSESSCTQHHYKRPQTTKKRVSIPHRYSVLESSRKNKLSSQKINKKRRLGDSILSKRLFTEVIKIQDFN